MLNKVLSEENFQCGIIDVEINIVEVIFEFYYSVIF